MSDDKTPYVPNHGHYPSILLGIDYLELCWLAYILQLRFCLLSRSLGL